jgi:hypothetical protein
MTRITTLIPAYKPEYLGEAFLGLRRQSFRDFQVILSDDSPGGVITEMIRDGRFGPLAAELNLLVVRGPGNARRNHEQLLDLWRGQSPLVHFQLDDDVIFPNFYRAHTAAHATGRFAATISQRWLSQTNSQPAWDLPLPAFINDSPLRMVPVTSPQLFASTVAVCENWLGELSNMVLSAEGASHYPRPPADALSYCGLLDIGALLEAGRHLPLLFLRDHLGIFRQHTDQVTRSTGSRSHRVALLAWAAFALHAWAEGRISAQDVVQAVSITVQRCMQQYPMDDPVMNAFYDIVQHEGTSIVKLHAAFTKLWLSLFADPSSSTAAVAIDCCSHADTARPTDACAAPATI